MSLYSVLYIVFIIISSLSLWAIYRIRKYLSVSFPDPTVVYRNEEDRNGGRGVYFGRQILPHTVKNVKFFVVAALCVELSFVLLVPLVRVFFPEATSGQEMYFMIVATIGIGCCGVLPLSAFGLPPFSTLMILSPQGFTLKAAPLCALCLSIRN